MRIASLLPSATEIICALGASRELVGISHECDFPAQIAGLPVLTQARLPPQGSSRQIDTAVRRVLRDALAVYDLELERLEDVAPDVIVTQDLCDVCAVSLDDVSAAVQQQLKRPEIRIVNLHPTRLADIWHDIEHVAEGIGRPNAAEPLITRIKARVETIAARAAEADERPSVLSIEWIDPVMIGGMWMPELIALAGGTPLVTTAGQHAPTLTHEQLQAVAPDVVVIKPCGFTLERTCQELNLLPKLLPWSTWPAVRNGRVYLADGNAYFNRPGPRIVESLEIMAACVHPGHFAELQQEHRHAVLRLARDCTVHALA